MDQTCVVPANSRGGKVLLNQGHRYLRKSTSTTQMRWICASQGCGAYLYTNFFDISDDQEVIVGEFIGPRLFKVSNCQRLTSGISRMY